jgi:hypothetical protein
LQTPGLFLVDRQGQTRAYDQPLRTAQVLSLGRWADSTTAWAYSADARAHRVNTALEVVTVQLPPGSPRVSQLALSSALDQPVGVRLHTYQLVFVDDQGKPLHDRPLNTGPVLKIHPGAVPRHGWLETDDEIEVFGTASELPRLRVEFDGHALESDRAAPEYLQAVPWRPDFRAQVVPGWSARASLAATLTLTVYDAEGKEVATGTSRRAVLDGSEKPIEVPLSWSGSRGVLGRPHTVELGIAGDNGSNLRIRWDEVRFTQPLLNRQFGMTALACVVLVSLLVLVGWLIVAYRSTTGWVVFLISSGSLLSGGLFGSFLKELERYDINTTALMVVLVVAFVGLLVWGIFQRSLFRVLVRIFPFNFLAPLWLRLGWVRRGMFFEAAERLRDEISRARQATPVEQYLSLPAQVVQPADPLPGSNPNDPAGLIANYLSHRSLDRRAHVYVESLGGLGKTALLREAVSRAVGPFFDVGVGSPPDTRIGRLLHRLKWIVAARQCPPLPVLLSAAPGEIGKLRLDKWLEQKIDEVLGADSVSAEILQAQMRSGDFVVVLDGLAEMGVEPAALRTFLVSEYGERVRLLMAGRPNPAYLDALAGGDRVVIVKLEPLSPDQHDDFRGNYGGAALPASLGALCGRDSAPSPLLVRLALLPEVRTPFDLLERALPWLLRCADEPGSADAVRAAAQLCVESCWGSGGRALDSAQARSEQVAILKRLVAAGLLVDSRSGMALRWKEFVPVGALDWLTARALAMGLVVGSDGKPAPLGRLLTQAAGRPSFREQGRNLFEMCVAVLEPDKLRTALDEELNRWLALPSFEPLTVELVVESSHQALQEELRRRLAVPWRLGNSVTEVKVALGEAIRLSAAAIDQQCHLFLKLLGHLWPHVGDATGSE